jgi:hypothetical protein
VVMIFGSPAALCKRPKAIPQSLFSGANIIVFPQPCYRKNVNFLLLWFFLTALCGPSPWGRPSLLSTKAHTCLPPLKRGGTTGRETPLKLPVYSFTRFLPAPRVFASLSRNSSIQFCVFAASSSQQTQPFISQNGRSPRHHPENRGWL